ncbi:MAG: single-stranded DNA-binding protein [Spirochaetes bacterium]|nr:single-stranded DNA-binding protein [Spirochaetota bacterium]
MNELNVITLIGRIVNEAELKTSAKGKSHLSITLANHSVSKEDKEETNFFKVRLWGKLAENTREYLKKGKLIAVCGRLKQYAFDSPAGDRIMIVEIVASQLQFLGGGNGKGKKKAEV